MKTLTRVPPEPTWETMAMPVEDAIRLVPRGVADRFRSVSFFVGPSLRQPVAEGRADFMPIFLSQIPGLFSSGRIPLDVALVQLSPPDQHGLCTRHLGGRRPRRRRSCTPRDRRDQRPDATHARRHDGAAVACRRLRPDQPAAP